MDIDVQVEAVAPVNFVLTPASWTKKVDKELRRKAVQELHGLLVKAFLSKYKLRAHSEEDELFDKLRSPRSSVSER